jgi:hypothetical protein
MTKQDTATALRRGWTVERFRSFWSNPDPTLVPQALTDDIVGHWSGRPEPVVGKDEYTGCIAAMVDALPDVHIDVAEHAQNDELTFIRWIMHATGKHGPFELTGIDRVRLRDGLVSENVIVFDTAAFERRSGMPVPWA